MLAALIRALRFTGAQLLSMWNALGPSPDEMVGNGRDAMPTASGAKESNVQPRPAVPPGVVSLTDVSTDVRFAALAAQGGNSDQVLQALMVLEQQGLAVTTVVRDQRGVRVKGIVGGQYTTRWYSVEECERLIARNAAEQAPAADVEPELVSVERKRRVWPSIWLSVVVLAGALTLMANWAGQFGGVLEELLR